jgi:hypothetical protein
VSNRRKIRGEGLGPFGALEMVGTGIKQEAPQLTRSQEDARLEPEGPGRHVWTATSMHRLSDRAAAATFDESLGRVDLDVETLVMVHVGCWQCEEPYSPELAKRRCPGQPPGELGYR